MATPLPPRRRPTMVDVAARAGVSRALVSLVFRGQPGASAETRSRVLAAAEELGYRPDSAARLLARGRSRTLGVLMTVREPFEADLVEAIYPEAERLGYEVLLSARTPGRDEATAVEGLLAHRCEAIVLLGPDVGDAFLTELGARTVAVVVGRAAPGLDSVHSADAEGVRQAVDHLVGLGHRDVVHVDGGTGPNAAARRTGYLEAMAAHGFGGRARVLPGAYHEDAGIAAAQALLAGPELPTAVLAANDRCALGLLDTLRRNGVDVPGRVSVVGYNDDRLARLSHVDLTTVRQDAGLLARHAVRAAAARLDDPDLEPGETELTPELVVRGTTAPPGVPGGALAADVAP
ncbi:LacI family transcriptional regulator [Pseudonocardia sp. RS11V-5]|uniref:LacI family DNA-binding transcriptional regulator n=1 Tax=Pseudonocardia terrae TaxID=2905831 RepID=UPI001E2B8464|nr:LacI family DNA-binding transcriptional regulator [Pseudonocardia terrae]MCE3554877.1 LacI family transcriptional regulator [Pseudonocardia terrae]